MKTLSNCERAVLYALQLLFIALMALHTHVAKAEPALVKGLCDDGREQSVALCYNKCKPGYTGFMATCLTTCPPGFVDLGLVCTDINSFAKESYGRGAGEPMGCKPGQWQNGLLCYENCQNGFYGVGPVCWQHCPPGTDTDWGLFCVRYPKIVGWGPCWWFICLPKMDWGFMHWKSSYGRGWGVPLNHCRPGTYQSGLLCYPNCKDGFSGAGPVCWQVCPHTHKDDGAFCRRDNGFFKDVYFRDAGVPINYCPDYDRRTRYPIILVHGWNGADTMRWQGGAATWAYFHGIAEAMRGGSRGANVFTASVAPVQTTETRGDQLLAFVKKVLKETGETRVHLIGHSQGATTSRYVASVAPEMVASVTSVSGVNHGPQLADILIEIAQWDAEKRPPERGWLKEAWDVFGRFVNVAAYNDETKYPVDNLNAFKSMSMKGMRIFNWIHPWGLSSYTKGQGTDWSTPLGFVQKITPAAYMEIAKLIKQPNGSVELLYRADSRHPIEREVKQYPVLYYSWGGVQPFGSVLDPVMYVMSILDDVMLSRGWEATDGLVEKSAARLGKLLGYYSQDHFATANMFLSVMQMNILWGTAHPISLYCEQANRLANDEKHYLGVYATGDAPAFYPVKTDPHGRPLQSTEFQLKDAASRYMQSLLNKSSPTTKQTSNYIAPAVPTFVKDGVKTAAISNTPKKSWEWQCLPGQNIPLRMNDMGEIESMSADGSNPTVAKSHEDCKITAELPPKADLIKPVVCGAPFKQKWGYTGYDKEGHWCHTARATLSDWQCRQTQDARFGFFRKNSKGDVQGFSRNGSSLEEQGSFSSCQQAINVRPSEAIPMTCGDKMKAAVGSTGYDNPNHWCAKNRDIQ